MPIRAEEGTRYSEHLKEIRAQIQARAGEAGELFFRIIKVILIVLFFALIAAQPIPKDSLSYQMEEAE